MNDMNVILSENCSENAENLKNLDNCLEAAVRRSSTE